MNDAAPNDAARNDAASSSPSTSSGAARKPVALIATHIAPAQGFGGVAECAGALARSWAGQGRAFTLAVSDGSCGPALRPADLGLPPAVDVHMYRASRRPRWGFGWGGVAAVWAACRDADRCYVCGVATWPTTLAYLFCRLLGRPYVAAVHGGMMPAHVAHIRRARPLKWLFYRLFVLPALRRAAAVHVTGAPEAAGVTAWLPAAATVTIPHGVDVAFWRTPPRVRAAGDGLRLCYVGRLSREKGILRFLEIWGRVRGPNDRFTVVGDGDDDYAAATRALAERLGDAVATTGVLDRAGVRRVVEASDFLVLPSGMDAGDVRENFGVAAAEALAAGRPLLAPRGLAWDMAGDEGFGVLFDPDEAGATAALRRAAAVCGPAYAAMAAAARTWAAANLDVDVAADRVWRSVAPQAAAGSPDDRPAGKA